MTNMERRTYVANRIKQVRTSRGITLEELSSALKSGITPSTVAKLENSRQALSADYLLEIAHALQVDPTDLLLERGATARMVPVIGRVAAGKWQEAVQMSADFMPIPGSIRGNNVFVLRPDGDSMDLIVQDGGFVVVDPEQRDLIDGKFYVVMNGDGEATFKRFVAAKMALTPCSSNPAHEPIAIGTAPFVTVGRVVYVGQEV